MTDDKTFLAEVRRRCGWDLPSVWAILRAVRESAPGAFKVFAADPGLADRHLRKKYARLIKPRLDADCYADFLFDLHCWYWKREVPRANYAVLRAGQARALRLHGKWKELGYAGNLAGWLRAQSDTRKRRGLGSLTRTEFARLERLYDSDSKRGKEFRALVQRILTGGKGLSVTRFEAEELDQFAREHGEKYRRLAPT